MEPASIRCRIAACPENLGDGQGWSFHLFNDGAATLELVVLHAVEGEWGDRSYPQATDVRVENLAPGAHVRIWRDDGEFRTELKLRVSSGGREAQLRFEFPKLYLQRRLQSIAGLEQPGWEVRAEA